MNYKYTLLIFGIFLLGCKNEVAKEAVKEAPLTLAEKIANAHGYQNWNHVSEVQFTFKVDRDTIKGNGRSWVWNPKSNDITMMTTKDTVSYNRTKIDSTSLRLDRAFTNDKFWLLFPFQLVWDESATLSKPIKEIAPISEQELNKATLLYPKEGGYTPGDAYDIYYDDDYLIKEWAFRKTNSEEPSIVNTFEKYQDFSGLKIAIDHKKKDGNWNLNFANIKVTLED